MVSKDQQTRMKYLYIRNLLIVFILLLLLLLGFQLRTAVMIR